MYENCTKTNPNNSATKSIVRKLNAETTTRTEETKKNVT